jgi:integrase
MVKIRSAAVDAYLENVWKALRRDAPVSLSHKQATALAGELYRAWVDGEVRERTLAMEHNPDTGLWRRVDEHHTRPEEWEAIKQRWKAVGESIEVDSLEKTLGPIIDRLLIGKGILRVDAQSRELLLRTMWQALQDAFEGRRRNAEGDYSPDPKAERFPEWQSARISETKAPRCAIVSLKGLVDEWWAEAKAIGRKPSTRESHSNAVAAFVAYLGHDDATRITRDDVVGFKNHRLATINPRNGRPLSAKTVKDNDLAGLKTILGWAVANGRLSQNVAEGVSIKLGKPRKLRSKGFTQAEASSILAASLHVERGGERLRTYAAKRWVPWLCAYTGARVGELAQLRKEDVRREGKHWIITITPEAGTVKTNEARGVVLHSHLVELGFAKFVQSAPPGHLFLKQSANGDVLGPLQGIKNRLAEFAREAVSDPNVAPNHGWRHTFKTKGLEAGIDHRVLDAIQGQQPRTVAEGYGEVTIKTLARAIAKFPRSRVAMVSGKGAGKRGK